MIDCPEEKCSLTYSYYFKDGKFQNDPGQDKLDKMVVAGEYPGFKIQAYR
jgi:hypothetical protein